MIVPLLLVVSQVVTSPAPPSPSSVEDVSVPQYATSVDVRPDPRQPDGPTVDVTAARRTLAGILSRREFSGARGPTAYDRLKQRVWAWVLGLLGRGLDAIAYTTVRNVFVLFVIAAAFVVVAWWMVRTHKRGGDRPARLPAGDADAVRAWREWLDASRAAADRRDWRDAVRLAHVCALEFLAARGTWRRDPSRTPREHLRLLPASSEQRATLGALTNLSERVWYGRDVADERAFRNALTSLEALGCPVA